MTTNYPTVCKRGHDQTINRQSNGNGYWRCKECQRWRWNGNERLLCVEPECPNLAAGGGRGWCYKHLHRARKYGSPLTLLRAPNGSGHTNKDGYREVYVNRKKRFEHHVVMERMLGRPLFADESVHHKNGVRSDNRTDNLELWSSSHPSGQRVEDKITWVLDFLIRYGYTVMPALNESAVA